MVARDLDLAADTGQAVHLMHLSARESVEHLERALARGVRASGEVTPHHLCLTDEAVRELDANMKMNPPLRTEDDRAILIAALRDGTIAAIATDHAPHSPEEKDVPFEAAPFGVIGLETVVRRRSTRSSCSPACYGSRHCSSGCRRDRRRSSASTGRGSPSARRRTSR